MHRHRQQRQGAISKTSEVEEPGEPKCDISSATAIPRGRLNCPQRRPPTGWPRWFPPAGFRKKVNFPVTIWRRLFFVEVAQYGIMHYHAEQKGAQNENTL